MIKVKGTEIAGPGTSSGDGTNLGNATMVRCYNSHASTARLVTIKTADEAATIGTFTIGPGAVEYLDKNNTDELLCNPNVLLSSVIIVG